MPCVMMHQVQRNSSLKRMTHSSVIEPQAPPMATINGTKRHHRPQDCGGPVKAYQTPRNTK